MASTKRERQRANREQGAKEAVEVEETAGKQQNYVKFGVIAAVIIIGLLLYAIIGRGGDDNAVTINTASAGEPGLAEWSQDAGSLDPELRNGIYQTASPNILDTANEYQAVIETENGEMRFLLFDDEAPLAVNNFVNLANDGFYDGLSFHRVLEGFMAQGGDPSGVGNGGPGYQFDNEFTEGIEFTKRGQLAMANAGKDTNGSQFFITFDAAEFLGGENYSLFGELIDGDDTLDAITLRDPDDNGPPGDIMTSVRIEVFEG